MPKRALQLCLRPTSHAGTLARQQLVPRGAALLCCDLLPRSSALYSVSKGCAVPLACNAIFFLLPPLHFLPLPTQAKPANSGTITRRVCRGPGGTGCQQFVRHPASFGCNAQGSLDAWLPWRSLTHSLIIPGVPQVSRRSRSSAGGAGVCTGTVVRQHRQCRPGGPAAVRRCRCCSFNLRSCCCI